MTQKGSVRPPELRRTASPISRRSTALAAGLYSLGGRPQGDSLMSGPGDPARPALDPEENTMIPGQALNAGHVTHVSPAAVEMPALPWSRYARPYVVAQTG